MATAPSGGFGSYKARVQQPFLDSNLTLNVSTIGYQNITFSFYGRAEALDGGEWLRAYYFNGTTWIELSSNQTLSSYILMSFNLPTSVNNNANFKIRFGCNANGATERCSVDNVSIRGINMTPIISNLKLKMCISIIN